MVRKDGAEVRKERISAVARFIQASLYQAKDGFISLKKTVAKLMLETGLIKEKVMEYLSLLEEAGQIEVDAKKDQIRRPTV